MHTIKLTIEISNRPAKKIVTSRLDWLWETCIVPQPNSIILNPSCWQHDGQCRPSIQNLIMANERSGQYLKCMC